MTREQARDFLIGAGIAEPTDDAISNILNQIGSETKKANDRANAYKAQADEAKDLRKQLDDIQNANLTEIEKANKATDDANTRVAELEKQIKAMQLKADLATQGIIGDVAENLIKSLEGGSFDASLLGQIITDREKLAVANYEKQKLAETPSATGGQGDDSKGAEPADVANAKALTFGNTVSQETKNFYKL